MSQSSSTADGAASNDGSDGHGDGNGSSNGGGRRRSFVFWATPATAVLGGIGFLIALIVAGHPALGAVALVFMLVVAAGIAVAAKRSETVKGVLDHQDERITGMDLRATAFTCVVLIVAVLVGAMVETARGHSGAPYTWLGALAGVTYLVALGVQRVRQ